MLRAILNKSWRQHPTRHQLYGHLPSITKTIQVRRTRHAGHCWRRRDELISDVLLLTHTYGRAKVGRSARKYIQQLCEDTGCSPEDLPEAMNDREKWRERVRDICASDTTWWWCWWYREIPSELPINKRTNKTPQTYISKAGCCPRPKWIKHVAAQVVSAHPSGWNVTLYLQLKRSFFFFRPISNFPLQCFLELIRPKRDYKIVNESF